MVRFTRALLVPVVGDVANRLRHRCVVVVLVVVVFFVVVLVVVSFDVIDVRVSFVTDQTQNGHIVAFTRLSAHESFVATTRSIVELAYDRGER